MIKSPRLAAVVITSIMLAGCADRRITLSYQPIPSPSAIPGAQPLTVFAFQDKRGSEGDQADPLRVGGVYGGYGNPLSKVISDRPFMPTLVNAIAEGFKARGVPVTAKGDLLFTPGATSDLALSGELRNFSTEARFTNSAHISGIVRLYDASGTLVVEKEVSSRSRSGLGGGVLTDSQHLEALLNEALTTFVMRVVTDAEITQRISGAAR